MSDTELRAMVQRALTNEDEIAHGEAWNDVRHAGLGRCAYCHEDWPCRTQRGIERLLAALAASSADSLDAAWAEAEAALPEGSWLTVKRQSPVAYLVETGTGYGTSLSIRWQAAADTPAAALRALAAKLRG